MILVDRWNPHRLDQKIASHFTLTLDQVHDIRQQPAFLEELARQSEISEQPFVNLADRKVRVVALQQLFEKVPDVRVALRLKILAQIRKEVFDAKFPHVHEAHAMDNTPHTKNACWSLCRVTWASYEAPNDGWHRTCEAWLSNWPKAR